MKKEAAEVEIDKVVTTDLPQNEVERQIETSTNGHHPQELIEVDAQPDSGNQPEQPEPRPSKPRRSISMRQIVTRFAGCHRCSFFFGGFQAQYSSRDELEAAISDADAPGFLSFAWSNNMRELLCKSYGIQLDVDFYYYEGKCDVCCRRFIFKLDENGEGEPTLTMGL